MEKIIGYEEFINESNKMYSIDGDLLGIGKKVLSVDGTSGMIISKTSNEGVVIYKDQNGDTWVANPEELMITQNNKEVSESFDGTVVEMPKKMHWYNIIKGIIAIDIIKSKNYSSGGIVSSEKLFPAWRNKVEGKLKDIAKDPQYIQIKATCDKITDKFIHDDKLSNLFAELAKNPYTDLSIKKYYIKKREFNKISQINNNRKSLIRQIAVHVEKSLGESEYNVLISIVDKVNSRISEMESVGTGTYTSTSSDKNVTTKGTYNTQDSASAGSHPV